MRPWPALRVGVVFISSREALGQAYVVIVRAAKRLPHDQVASFWLAGPEQRARGHEVRPAVRGRRGTCYVAYFYADEQSPRDEPKIFPPPAEELANGFRARGRVLGGERVRLIRATDGLGGATQAHVSARVGCG